MTCKTLLLAMALAGMAGVAFAADGGETTTMADGSEQLAKAVGQAKTCEQVNQELNELLKRSLDEAAKKKKAEKEAICNQKYAATNEKIEKPKDDYKMPSSGFGNNPVMDDSKLYASDNSMDKVQVVKTKLNENPSLGGESNKLTMGYMKEVGGNTVGSAKFRGQGTTISAHEVNVNSNMLNGKSIGSYSIKEMNDAGTVKVGLASKVGSINPNNSNQPAVIPLGQQISFDSKAYLKDGTIKANNAVSGYGIRTNPVTGKVALHAGTDYNGKMADGVRNTDILASGSGKVIESKCVSGGYGCSVVIDHGNGVYTRYAHLKDMDVKVGDTVAQGNRIATMGTTGRSEGVHLHYEVLNGGTSGKNNAVATIGGTSTYNEQVAGKFGSSAERPVGIAGNSGSGGGSGSGYVGGGSTGGGSNVATGGLGNTLQNMLGGNNGIGSLLDGGSGSGNSMNQLLSQLFNGGGSSGSSSRDDDSYGSSGSYYGGSSATASDKLVVKTVTEVAANGDTTRTTTYASGRSEQITVKNTGTKADLDALLTSAMGKTSADSVLASIKALCASRMATSSDADMLKISQCQSGT